MTPLLAAEIADEQFRYWRFVACITASDALKAMHLTHVRGSWEHVRFAIEVILLDRYGRASPARLAA